MKDSLKKFFLLGLSVAAAGMAAGFAVKHHAQIKKAVEDVVNKGKLTKEEGEALLNELKTEVEKIEKKVKGKLGKLKKAASKSPKKRK